jgi:hypothetical protein
MEVKTFELKPLVKGLLTFVPGAHRIFSRHGTGGTESASYCYAVWLKHLTFLWQNNMRSMPRTIAELGPGDSLGVGLAAILSGVNSYYALDVIRFSNPARNLKIFDQLVALLKARAPRPSKGWPDSDAQRDNQLFPRHILTDELLEASLREERLDLIRAALVNPASNGGEVSIKYMVPWLDERVIEKESVDIILSHAVLEHVADLETTYRALYSWLKAGGIMSHQIDFTSHGFTEKWNGHWACSEALWKIVIGRRPILINRQPSSSHVKFMERNGFRIICHLKHHRSDGIGRSQLSSTWRELSDDDLTCSGDFIQAQKL